MPRIPPLPPDEWGDDVIGRHRRAAAAGRHAGAAAQRRVDRKGLNVLGTLAQHPALMQAYHTFNGHILYTNTLDARQRELLVLRVAARRGAEYEWRQHVHIAADARLHRRRHRADRRGSARRRAGRPSTRRMLRAVDELVRRRRDHRRHVGGAGR